MGLDGYGLSWQVGPLALGMTSQAMFLPGNPTQINRNISDDFGVSRLVNIMQGPVFPPPSVG